MKMYFAGEKSKAICQNCGLVSTTFQYRDVKLAQSHRLIKNILVGVCDTCDATVSTPAQSTPAIKAQRKRTAISIEALLPSPYLEALDLACLKINTHTALDMRKRLLLYYVHQHAHHQLDPQQSIKAHQHFLSIIPKDTRFPNKRLSMKVSQHMADEFDLVVTRFKQNKTNTLKTIVAEIKHDILDNNQLSQELHTLSLIADA